MRRLDDEVLRSLGHVQAHVDAGDGSETIIHSLANQAFGKLTARFTKLLEEMQQGAPFETTMKREFDVARKRESERGYALLVAALATEGGDLETRLENITDEVMTRNKQAAEDHAGKVKFLAYVALLLVMLTVFLPLGQVFTEAGAALSGETDAQAAIEAVEPFDPAPFYGIVGVFVGIFMAFMVRWR